MSHPITAFYVTSNCIDNIVLITYVKSSFVLDMDRNRFLLITFFKIWFTKRNYQNFFESSFPFTFTLPPTPYLMKSDPCLAVSNSNGVFDNQIDMLCLSLTSFVCRNSTQIKMAGFLTKSSEKPWRHKKSTPSKWRHDHATCAASRSSCTHDASLLYPQRISPLPTMHLSSLVCPSLT